MTIDRAEEAFDHADARMRWLAWQPGLCLRWYAFARRNCRVHSDDADDLVQEVVARTLYRHLATPFPSADDAACWGITVLGNLVRDQVRRDQRHADVRWEDVPETTTEPSGGPHEIFEDRERARLVAKAIASLQPRDQAAIRARFHDQLTYSEAGALFGIGESAYGVRLHRALQRLKIKLANATFQWVPPPIFTWETVKIRRGSRPSLAQALAGAAAVVSFAGGHGGAAGGLWERPPAIRAQPPAPEDPAEPDALRAHRPVLDVHVAFGRAAPSADVRRVLPLCVHDHEPRLCPPDDPPEAELYLHIQVAIVEVEVKRPPPLPFGVSGSRLPVPPPDIPDL